jgi:hypothetical protein
LYAGTSSGVWEMTQLPDSDFDGVPDALEGVTYSSQSNVAYVPPHGSATGSTPPKNAPLAPAGNNDFIIDVTPQSGSCTQAQDVQYKLASADGPDPTATDFDYTYSVDLVQFEILNCTSATVKITYPNFTFGPGWSFRFYGPATPGDDASIKWYDFSPPHAVRLDAHTWQLTLTKGAFGSYRPSVTGSILFHGGPALSDRVFAGGFN